MIQEISESDNNVIIKPGSSRFTHNSYLKSQREWHKSSNPYYSKMLQAGYDFEGGTGGTVEWNSRGDVLPTTSGGKIAPAMEFSIAIIRTSAFFSCNSIGISEKDKHSNKSIFFPKYCSATMW